MEAPVQQYDSSEYIWQISKSRINCYTPCLGFCTRWTSFFLFIFFEEWLGWSLMYSGRYACPKNLQYSKFSLWEVLWVVGALCRVLPLWSVKLEPCFSCSVSIVHYKDLVFKINLCNHPCMVNHLIVDAIVSSSKSGLFGLWYLCWFTSHRVIE